MFKQRISHYVDKDINDMFERLKDYTDKKSYRYNSRKENIPLFMDYN